MINHNPFTRRVAHIVGRTVYLADSLWKTVFRTKNVDETVPDYSYWDRFRHSLISGYEYSGILAQALIEKLAAWVIGRAITVKLAAVRDRRMEKKVSYTNDALRRLFISYQGEIIEVYQDLLAMGDQFIFVNPDGSLVRVSPDMVDIEYDPTDFRKVKKYKIVTVLDDYRVIDEYTETERTVRIEKGAQNGTVISTTTYPVLIGRFPIVHFTNDRGPNEQRGHPIYESMRPLLSEYNDMLKKGMQGAKVAGNPIPVIENLFDPDETLERMATTDDDTYTDKDGNTETRRRIKWDEQSAILLGEGGKFKFAAPPVGFSEDILSMLKQLFNLIIYRYHTPEHLWGVGVEISKGVEEQTPMWVRFIEGRRDKFAGVATDEKLGITARGGLHELIEVWLRTKALTDSQIYVGPTVISWSDLTEKDRSLTFEWVKYLVSRGLMTGKTALEKSGLTEDVETEYESAQAELEKSLMTEPGAFDDFSGVDERPLTSDGTEDLRKTSGASAPRMPAYGGGGKTKP